MSCRLARSLARSAPAGRRLGLPPSFAQLSRLCPVKPGKPASPGTGPGENLSFRISGNTCPPTCPRRDQRAQLPASPARHDLISDETRETMARRWAGGPVEENKRASIWPTSFSTNAPQSPTREASRRLVASKPLDQLILTLTADDQADVDALCCLPSPVLMCSHETQSDGGDLGA